MEVLPDALYQAISTDLHRSVGKEGLEFVSKAYTLPNPGCVSSPSLVACAQLLNSITKKYQAPKRNSVLSERAISSFLESNRLCQEFKPDPRSPLISQMRHIAYQELPALDWQEVLAQLEPGPGASVGSQGRNSALEKLFVNSLSTTKAELYSEYRQFMQSHPTWWSAELRRIFIQRDNSLSIVLGSNLTTVPKNSRTDRTVCTEPSLNMLFQKALGETLNGVLRRAYSYDPAIQPSRNQEMACKGSRDGSLATIDLSNASDMISYTLCAEILPKDWIAAIDDCRSPITIVDGDAVKLNMVASMGNGFTFPLETYIFSLMIRALCSLNKVKFTRFSHREFGVFGDDIIVPTQLFELTMEGLKELGFIPNPEKSFAESSFRESCGADWFNGFNVRGVYCKRLRTRQDHFSLINRLNRWSARWQIPLPDTIALLLPKGWKSAQIPTDEADDAGIKVPEFMKVNRSRWYTAYKPRKRLIRLFRKELLRKQFDNPLGLLCCASVGWLRSEGIQRREDVGPFYERVRGFTPCWVRPPDLLMHGVGVAD